MSDAQAADPPFWSDAFDMDFPKIFPEARALLGELADVEMSTTGHTTFGRLNHPAVWNGDHTMLAFFTFYRPRRPTGAERPAGYVTGGADHFVRCTAWEMFRDAWAHSYCIHVARIPVWDTFALSQEFETIMWHMRGWGRTTIENSRARKSAWSSYERAVRTFRDLVLEYGADLPGAAA